MRKTDEIRARAPNQQVFDEIRIVTRPRYKTSDLSGDEWRTSSAIEFYKDGKVVHTARGGRDVETAVMFLGARYLEAHDELMGDLRDATICDQEGCSELAEVYLRIKKGYTQRGDERGLDERGEYRAFCERHSTRGDCGLDDADTNYEQMGGAVVEPETRDESPSVFGGVIHMTHDRDR